MPSQEIITMTLAFLVMGFPLWKVVAMVLGLSYRYRWVRRVDVLWLSAVAGLCALIRFGWDGLKHHGSGWIVFVPIAGYFGLMALFTALSYVMDNGRRNIRKSREADD